MHKRRRLKRTTPRTARPAAIFLLEFHLLSRPLSPLAVVSRAMALLDQLLRQMAADSWQGVADFGHHERQKARLAAAQGGNEGE